MPALPAVCAAHQPRTGYESQDRHLIVPGAVAVLDGATNPDEPPDRDGGWYAEQVAATLRAHLVNGQHRDLADVVFDALAQLVDTETLEPGRSPSSTLSILRWTDHRVEVYVLGDSPVVVTFHDGTTLVIRDSRLDALAADNRAAYQDALRRGQAFGPEVAALGREARDLLRDARNIPGGYWIAEATPAAAHEAIRKSLLRNTIREVLLCTDGASAAVDVFELFSDWPSLLADVQAHGLSSLLPKLNDAAARDPNGQRWPRRKYDDDATAIHVRFTS